MPNRPMAALIRRLRVTAAAAEAIPTATDVGLKLQLEALSTYLQAQARSFERHVPEAEIVQPAVTQAPSRPVVMGVMCIKDGVVVPYAAA